MNPTSRKPLERRDEPVPRATYVLDREGRIIETNEMFADLPFCHQTEQLGERITQRVDHDSACILNAFLKDPGATLAGHVDFCFMRGDGYYSPTFLTIQALIDAEVVVGFVVHVEPASGAARPKTKSPQRGARRNP